MQKKQLNRYLLKREKDYLIALNPNLKELENELQNKIAKDSIVREVIKKNFDNIIISPGINISRCKLSKYLKKNQKKIIIFYWKNISIFFIHSNGFTFMPASFTFFIVRIFNIYCEQMIIY